MPVSESKFPGANATSTPAGTGPGDGEPGETETNARTVSIHFDDGTQQSLLNKHDGDGIEYNPGMENGRHLYQNTCTSVNRCREVFLPGSRGSTAVASQLWL